MQINGCIIYSTGKFSLQELRKNFKVFLEGKASQRSFIETATFEVSVNKNEDYDEQKETTFPDGFLHFKFIIELIFPASFSTQKCAYEVSKILIWLWQHEAPSVASCDYENLLPFEGGYKSLNVPWPSSR